MNKTKAKEIEEKYVSECCNAEIEVMGSDMPDSGFRIERYVGYRCTKCFRPCEIKKKRVA